VTDSIIHTEIKLSADGPKLIEVNGRLGGRPPFVLGAVSNVNLFQVACDVAHGSAGCLRRSGGLRRRRLLVHGAAPDGGAPGDARAGSRAALRSSRRRHRERESECRGEPVDWREGTASHIVAVRGRADDYDALEKTIKCVRERLRIDYEG
jgi:hypothetical protein